MGFETRGGGPRHAPHPGHRLAPGCPADLPLASGRTLALLIDRVIVTAPSQVTVPVVAVIVVATHFAIVAINAAVRFGLHEQYYDYVFRYRLQDTFAYRFCEELTQLDIP